MSDARRQIRQFVGMIWIGDDPAIRLRVQAVSVEEARKQVVAQYGEGHTISIWNENDASKPRGGAMPTTDE